MTRRLVQLVVGLWLYGVTMALMVRAGLGLNPWDVFHEGLTHHVPLTFGQVVIAVGAVVLLAWIPLRQRPGLGTVLNVLVIGVAADVTLAMLPPAESVPVAVVLLIAGVVGNGLAGAMYVAAGLGAGPRDGLWTGIVARTGASVRLVRTLLEVGVVVAGFALGGTIGLGTVLYALGIGPLVQLFLPWFEPRRPPAAGPVTT